MNHIFGLWNKLNDEGNKHIGELFIDGNHLELYVRDTVDPFDHILFGSDGERYYMVSSIGDGLPTTERLLYNSNCLHVRYAIVQNQPIDYQGNDVLVKSFSFVIPELINWIDDRTVCVEYCEDGSSASEKNMDPIPLKEESPKVWIGYESESLLQSIHVDPRTTQIIKNQPRVYVTYSEPVSIDNVFMDITVLMQFWGLNIGRVSIVDDIRLTFVNPDHEAHLYLNHDYSYNLPYYPFYSKSKTTFSMLRDKLIYYFGSWYSFCANDTFSSLRHMFFFTNQDKKMYIDDAFIEYVRILEGYHLRTSADEAQSQNLKDAISSCTREIKKLIFTDEGKPLFERVLKESIPDWNFNSSHANDIAHWIAQGYLARTGLRERLQKLDSHYFSLISLNAPYVLSTDNPRSPYYQNKNPSISFFDSIVATRNIFAHYKADISKMLSTSQKEDTINILKAMIIMIWYENMGMDQDLIRDIMIRDEELHFITSTLIPQTKS